MKVAGLFAGVGGLELGLARAGHHSVHLCEIWEPARAVLQKQFPGVPLSPDISKLEDLPEDTEILAAGFPCQDLSQAGRTHGIEGSRSGLVSNVFRLIDKRHVPVVVLENVSFMLQLNRGQAMTRLVEAFEERGYRWAYRVVNSLAFLQQRRERVFLVATLNDIDPRDVLFADSAEWPEQTTSLETHAHGFYWTEGTRGLGWAPNGIPTLKNGSTVGISSPPAILLPNGNIIKPDIRDAERLQGFEPGWTAAAESVDRSSFRWSLVGNAVTVPVAEWLGKRLAEPGKCDRERERPLADNTRWPKAAAGSDLGRLAVEIGSAPLYRERADLHEFLHFPGTPLSSRATRGFLKRAESSTLRFAPGFLDRVRAHLDTMEPLSIAAQ